MTTQGHQPERHEPERHEPLRTLSKRNQWSYSAGTLGRDMVFTLVSLFILIYIQYTMALTATQFATISGIMILARIWDAINDPMMGVIIENSRFKSGKFRPWILIGALINFGITIALFTIRPAGWAFVGLFGVFYILWGMSYTMNDIAFWSLLPNLARGNEERNKLTTLLIVFASIGQFLTGGLVPILVAGDAVAMYRNVAIFAAIMFLLCTLLTYFGVQEPEREDSDAVGLGEMIKVLKTNDQLRVSSFAVFLHTVAAELFVALSLHFFYFNFGYGGEEVFFFTIAFAIGSLSATGAFPLLSKKMNRAVIINLSIAVAASGYTLFFLTGTVLPQSLILIYLSAYMVFFGHNLFFVVLVIYIANTIEYHEYKTGHRRESVIFAMRPFMTKLGAAAQQGLVTLLLIISGVYGYTRRIAELEQQKALGIADDITEAANEVLSLSTSGMKVALQVGMAVMPFLAILIAFIAIRRKYRLTEKTHEAMLQEIASRDH